jgi:hypothetical protein
MMMLGCQRVNPSFSFSFSFAMQGHVGRGDDRGARQAAGHPAEGVCECVWFCGMHGGGVCSRGESLIPPHNPPPFSPFTCRSTSRPRRTTRALSPRTRRTETRAPADVRRVVACSSLTTATHLLSIHLPFETLSSPTPPRPLTHSDPPPFHTTQPPAPTRSPPARGRPTRRRPSRATWRSTGTC